MNKQAARTVKPKWPVLMTAAMFCLIAPRSHAEEAEAPPKGAAVTVLKAAKFCFGNNVEVSGILHAAGRDRGAAGAASGLKVAEVMADAGETVIGRADAGAAEPAGRRQRAGAGAGRRA